MAQPDEARIRSIGQELLDQVKTGMAGSARLIEWLLRDESLKLRLFRDLKNTLEQQPNQQVHRMFLLETFIIHMPQENYETMFATFLSWARFGNLFTYDEDTEMISLL